MKNVVVLANYSTSVKNVIPYLPYTGQWQNLMDDTILNMTSTTTPVTLQPGEFRILGNYTGSLSTADVNAEHRLSLQIADNPVKDGNVKLIYHKAINGEIIISEMSGKKLDTFKLNNESGSYELKVNYPAGIYLVQLKSETGMAIQKMIIK